nr:MAG TPA: Membrane fusion protein Use1 [Herelleviridae sp.]
MCNSSFTVLIVFSILITFSFYYLLIQVYQDSI